LGPVRETPEETLPAQENRFVMNSVARARELEAAGEPPEALRQYKIALTVRPNQGAAKEGRERLGKALQKDAEEHYRAGLRMQKEGRHAQALQQFLTALRFWPDHREALQMATRRIPVLGDKAVVQKTQPELQIKDLSAKQPAAADDLSTPEKAPAREDPKELVDQVAVYREYALELYLEGRYQEALSEFNKVLSVKPNDSVAKEYSYKSSFELALEFFQKKEYLAAKEQFLVSLKHNSNCQQCHFYIRRSEELYKEMHYKQGIEHYGKEQLTHAIMEWELVSALDPKYKRVDYYIKKAKDLQSKIDELKKESKEQSQE
jgi:tetratricopeptide (TPR) repeat protein